MNIMYAALLLVVLFERAVAMEFPDDAHTQKNKQPKAGISDSRL